MKTRLVLAAALLLTAAPIVTRAGCCLADPSAMDVDPTATPLTVAHDEPAVELVVAWEAHRSDTRLYQGDLDALWATDRLNDQPAGDTPDAALRIAMPTGNAYFLVSGSCDGLHCTRGRDAAGNERGTPGCEILERGEMYPDVARCLGVGQGVIRDAAEYELFAACYSPGTAPDPPTATEALVWVTDYASSACGTCLEFPCARLFGNELVVERKGQPWGDCDAIHDGGAWARVPAVDVITILEEMPPFPEYAPCH